MGDDATNTAEWATDGSGNLSFGGTTNTVDAFLNLSGATNGSLFVRIDYSSWNVGATDGDEQSSFLLEGTGNVRLQLLRFTAVRSHTPAVKP